MTVSLGNFLWNRWTLDFVKPPLHVRFRYLCPRLGTQVWGTYRETLMTALILPPKARTTEVLGFLLVCFYQKVAMDPREVKTTIVPHLGLP